MNKTIAEPARFVDVVLETDVLVVGSGPGGLAAALASARAGVQTALLDRNGCFGGDITQVGVEGFARYRHERTGCGNVQVGRRCARRGGGNHAAAASVRRRAGA